MGHLQVILASTNQLTRQANHPHTLAQCAQLWWWTVPLFLCTHCLHARDDHAFRGGSLPFGSPDRADTPLDCPMESGCSFGQSFWKCEGSPQLKQHPFLVVFRVEGRPDVDLDVNSSRGTFDSRVGGIRLLLGTTRGRSTIRALTKSSSKFSKGDGAPNFLWYFGSRTFLLWTGRTTSGSPQFM